MSTATHRRPGRLTGLGQLLRLALRRDVRDRRLPRIAGPCSLVLFGVTRREMGTVGVAAVRDFITPVWPGGISIYPAQPLVWQQVDSLQITYAATPRHGDLHGRATGDTHATGRSVGAAVEQADRLHGCEAAAVAGRDHATDLAVLRLEGVTLDAAERGAEPRVGHLVLALGRPGANVQATLGVVSALDNEAWRTPMGGQIDQYMQTDVVMYPGFSGGPLINASGQVLALNTSALVRGVSVAIPLATLDAMVETLLTHGRLHRGLAGDVGARAEGHTHLGGSERGSVVRAVTCHSHHAAVALEGLDDPELVVGGDPCHDGQVRHQFVERAAIDVAGDRLVIPDRPDPRSCRLSCGGSAQDGGVVGLEQGGADLGDGLADIGLGDGAAAGNFAHRARKAFGESFEHGVACVM